MKRQISKLACIVLCIGIISCALPTEEEENTLADYHNRVLEFSRELDDDTETAELIITKVYDGTKKQTIEVVNTYNENGVKVLSETFDCDENGKKPEIPIQYTEYTYYEDGDHDGKLHLADTFDSEGTKVAYREITYNTDETYKSSTDYILGEEDFVEDRKEEKYFYGTGEPFEGELRVEKFFNYDTDETVWELKKETAYWYEEAESGEGARISHKLNHSFRGENSEEEVYFYKPYSYTGGDNVYLESDFEYNVYDADDNFIAGFPRDGYSSFDATAGDADPFIYQIEYGLIGEQQNMVLFDFNERQLVAKETLYTFGSLQETRLYAYNADDNVISMSRYINKGQLLEEKIVMNYREETLEDGNTYDVKETITYRFTNIEVE